jgi:hypothetical protein
MTHQPRNFVLLAAIAAAMLPVTAARAQLYGSSYAPPAPLYPYAVQQNQTYAVQVAPNTYVIQRPSKTRAYSNAPCRNCRTAEPAPEQGPPRFDRPHQPVEHRLVEELRKRVKRTVINTTKVVHDPPVVVETERVVDDPPRVIERRHIVEDEPVRGRRKHATVEDVDNATRPSREDGKKRVIQADAEVTILGPDRMSIRLFRKGHNAKAKAQVDE